MTGANDPTRKSWIDVDPESDFPIQNLPFGIFETDEKSARAGMAIGKTIVDLQAIQEAGFLDPLKLPKKIFAQPTLNAFIKLGKDITREVRNRMSALLDSANSQLRDDKALREKVLVPMNSARMLLPIQIGDYTDFYSSEEHATNVGTMFRDPKNALLPNWKHLPVAYHGRASSIIPSGVPIYRPKGQTLPKNAEEPVFGPTKRLDFELEMAFITYDGKPLGESISTSEAEDYIFGMVLFNDWSARDIQRWEYVPLGPFLAKNFASSISPWIVTLDALEPFRVAGKTQAPKVLPYLEFKGEKNYDINLEVYIKAQGSDPTRVGTSNFKYMYWNMCQQLAHHTVNGCNIRSGDMMASGTISGPDKGEFGSMLELSWNGATPLKMSDGSERTFIEDGDTVIMKGYCEKSGVKIGFGEVSTRVLPAK